jgi:uncharacterized protein YabN with tetrapyrrole methylase and pyrophosphatase domain
MSRREPSAVDGKPEELTSGQQVNQAVEDEIGDLLFAVVNLARKCKLDAKSILQTATDKFVARFDRLEDELQGRLYLVSAVAPG